MGANTYSYVSIQYIHIYLFLSIIFSFSLLLTLSLPLRYYFQPTGLTLLSGDFLPLVVEVGPYMGAHTCLYLNLLSKSQIREVAPHLPTRTGSSRFTTAWIKIRVTV